MVKRNPRRRRPILREGEQVPTRLVTIAEIMADPTFMLGVADARAGRPYHRDYDLWPDCNLRWSYERGRQWAALAPPSVPLKLNGHLNPDAVAIYTRHSEDIR